MTIAANFVLLSWVIQAVFKRFKLLYYYLFFFAIQPHGLNSGCFALVRPPFGWSTGFFATPRTLITFLAELKVPQPPCIILCKKKLAVVLNKQYVCNGNSFNFVDGNST